MSLVVLLVHTHTVRAFMHPQVFTAGADGSLRSWTISRSGELEAGPAVEKAHEGRVVACLVSEGRVYTTSYDGSIKVRAWAAHAHMGTTAHGCAGCTSASLLTHRAAHAR